MPRETLDKSNPEEEKGKSPEKHPEEKEELSPEEVAAETEKQAEEEVNEEIGRIDEFTEEHKEDLSAEADSALQEKRGGLKKLKEWFGNKLNNILKGEGERESEQNQEDSDGPEVSSPSPTVDSSEREEREEMGKREISKVETKEAEKKEKQPSKWRRIGEALLRGLYNTAGRISGWKIYGDIVLAFRGRGDLYEWYSGKKREKQERKEINTALKELLDHEAKRVEAGGEEAAQHLTKINEAGRKKLGYEYELNGRRYKIVGSKRRAPEIPAKEAAGHRYYIDMSGENKGKEAKFYYIVEDLGPADGHKVTEKIKKLEDALFDATLIEKRQVLQPELDEIDRLYLLKMSREEFEKLSPEEQKQKLTEARQKFEQLPDNDETKQKVLEAREKAIKKAENKEYRQRLASILREYRKANKELSDQRDKKIEQTSKLYIQKKVHGLVVAKDALNALLIGADLVGGRALMYAGVSAAERYVKASSEFEKKNWHANEEEYNKLIEEFEQVEDKNEFLSRLQEGKLESFSWQTRMEFLSNFDKDEKGKLVIDSFQKDKSKASFVTKDMFVNATSETLRAAAGMGKSAEDKAKGGVVRTVQVIEAWGKIARLAGITTEAVDVIGTGREWGLIEQLRAVKDELTHKDASEILSDAVLKNPLEVLSRAAYRITHPAETFGKILEGLKAKVMGPEEILHTVEQRLGVNFSDGVDQQELDKLLTANEIDNSTKGIILSQLIEKGQVIWDEEQEGYILPEETKEVIELADDSWADSTTAAVDTTQAAPAAAPDSLRAIAGVDSTAAASPDSLATSSASPDSIHTATAGSDSTAHQAAAEQLMGSTSGAGQGEAEVIETPDGQKVDIDKYLEQKLKVEEITPETLETIKADPNADKILEHLFEEGEVVKLSDEYFTPEFAGVDLTDGLDKGEYMKLLDEIDRGGEHQAEARELFQALLKNPDTSEQASLYLSTVNQGQGITHALVRQFKLNPELAEKAGLSRQDLDNDLKLALAARRLAEEHGYIKYDNDKIDQFVEQLKQHPDQYDKLPDDIKQIQDPLEREQAIERWAESHRYTVARDAGAVTETWIKDQDIAGYKLEVGADGKLHIQEVDIDQLKEVEDLGSQFEYQHTYKQQVEFKQEPTSLEDKYEQFKQVRQELLDKVESGELDRDEAEEILDRYRLSQAELTMLNHIKTLQGEREFASELVVKDAREKAAEALKVFAEENSDLLDKYPDLRSTLQNVYAHDLDTELHESKFLGFGSGADHEDLYRGTVELAKLDGLGEDESKLFAKYLMQEAGKMSKDTFSEMMDEKGHFDHDRFADKVGEFRSKLSSSDLPAGDKWEPRVIETQGTKEVVLVHKDDGGGYEYQTADGEVKKVSADELKNLLAPGSIQSEQEPVGEEVGIDKSNQSADEARSLEEQGGDEETSPREFTSIDQLVENQAVAEVVERNIRSTLEQWLARIPTNNDTAETREVISKLLERNNILTDIRDGNLSAEEVKVLDIMIDQVKQDLPESTAIKAIDRALDDLKSGSRRAA